MVNHTTIYHIPYHTIPYHTILPILYSTPQYAWCITHYADWDYDFTGSMRTVSFGNMEGDHYESRTSRRSSKSSKSRSSSGSEKGKKSKMVILPCCMWWNDECCLFHLCYYVEQFIFYWFIILPAGLFYNFLLAFWFDGCLNV